MSSPVAVSTTTSRLAPIRGLLGLACAVLAQPAAADPTYDPGPPPESFTVPACYRLARSEGRMIAWARWEQGFSLEKTRSGQVAAGTPDWMIRILEAWITDAYSWQVTDEQIYQWAAELGNTAHLPSAQRVSRHETIAIWMRRIARQCQALGA
jgi:hypothetical protein